MDTHRNEYTWRAIVALYQAGDVSMTALARRFGLSHEAIRQGLKRRGLIQVRSQLKRKTACGIASN